MATLDAERNLLELTKKQSGNWALVGMLLLELESQSRTDATGRPWQDRLLDRLLEVNASISAGHLYKIRRAATFLQEQAQGAIRQAIEYPPKISSIEVAERLFRIDQHKGLQALHDALGPDPVPYIDLKKRYDEALTAHPEMRSPRQIAWEARRKATGAIKKPNEASEDQDNKTEKQLGPSGAIHEQVLSILAKSWKEGWEAALSQNMSEIEELRDQLREREEEIKILVRKVRDLRGYAEDMDGL